MAERGRLPVEFWISGQLLFLLYRTANIIKTAVINQPVSWLSYGLDYPGFESLQLQKIYFLQNVQIEPGIHAACQTINTRVKAAGT